MVMLQPMAPFALCAEAQQLSSHTCSSCFQTLFHRLSFSFQFTVRRASINTVSAKDRRTKQMLGAVLCLPPRHQFGGSATYWLSIGC